MASSGHPGASPRKGGKGPVPRRDERDHTASEIGWEPGATGSSQDLVGASREDLIRSLALCKTAVMEAPLTAFTTLDCDFDPPGLFIRAGCQSSWTGRRLICGRDRPTPAPRPSPGTEGGREGGTEEEKVQFGTQIWQGNQSRDQSAQCPSLRLLTCRILHLGQVPHSFHLPQVFPNPHCYALLRFPLGPSKESYRMKQRLFPSSGSIGQLPCSPRLHMCEPNRYHSIELFATTQEILTFYLSNKGKSIP